MSTATRSRMIAALLLALAAGAGFATGVATDRTLLARSPTGAAPAGEPPAGEGIRMLLRGHDTLPADGTRRVRIMLPTHMGEDLGLTPQQQEAIERIVREEQAAIRELTEQLHPAFMSVVERSRTRIQEVLTEEQLARWRAAPAMRLRRGPEPPPNN
jgi:hypothetical protein